MNNQNPQAGNIEAYKGAKTEVAEKSNLSETARLVNGMMKEYVMPALREKALVGKANEIIGGKLKAEDPKVLQFALDCKKLQGEIKSQAQAKGCSEQQLAVVDNYFTKLLGSMGSPEV